MKLAIIGTGYVGLVTGTCFADCGNDVICIDKDVDKIEGLKKGKIPIYEPGLEELVLRNSQNGRLKFSTNLAEGVAHAEIIFIAVGTPQSEDGSADLSTVWAVTDALARVIPGPRIVVVKSTVPVGTNRGVLNRLRAGCAHPVDVASNPEFLKEGAAIEDCTKPDRVVVGCEKPETGEVLRQLYAPFLRTDKPFLMMSLESAEMTKYVANAMLATKISFINEMANLCERMGADINDVRRGIGHDVRIGFQFLHPGPGYGGSCFTAEETLFVERDGALVAEPIERLFLRAEGIGRGETVEVRELADTRVLAYDLETNQPTLAGLRVLTRRPYDGDLVTLRTGMGRELCVTEDHPVIRRTPSGDTEVVLAHTIRPHDDILALCAMPEMPPVTDLDLIERLQGTALADDVHISPIDDTFTRRYNEFAAHIPESILRHPVEIRDHNRMPLRLFYLLRERGVLDVPSDRLQLYTAKGAATKLSARIAIDADLLRLCGYYLAEGFITQDTGRAGAVRDRVGFSFHENEEEYIADLRRILARYGLKWVERHATSARTTLVSSRVFAWLLRDVLGCGVRSEDKRLPGLAFQVNADLRRELIRGAFSGDGAVTRVQGGRNMLFEYATVSPQLANGLALLLQSVGIVPSLRTRWMNKSTQPAHLVRITGYNQLADLRDAFGGKHRATIDAVLAGYQRVIAQRGFRKEGPCAVLSVRVVQRESVQTSVYSLETTTGTVVVGSGLIVHNCFPKDVRAIMSMGQKVGNPLHLMQSVDDVNEAQKHVLIAKVKAHYGERLKGRTLAIWGLAFKPRTDDIREAPALVLIDALLEAGVSIRVHDPEAMPNVQAIYKDRITYCDRPYGALEGADGLAIVTEWTDFRNPDFEIMKRLLNEKVVFDGRNIYDPRVMGGHGFTYYSIGRKDVKPA